MKRHHFTSTAGCPIFSEQVADFAALEDLSALSVHTILLIVADARGVHTDIIARTAKRWLDAGLVYVCVWGPGCERVHDIFDEVHVGDGCSEPASRVMMSTWHSKESLEEAIWFFVHCAVPLDTEMETTSCLAVTVGSSDWAAAVDIALSDLPAFHARMLDTEAA